MPCEGRRRAEKHIFGLVRPPLEKLRARVMVMNDKVVIGSQEKFSMDAVGKARKQHPLSPGPAVMLTHTHVKYAESRIPRSSRKGTVLRSQCPVRISINLGEIEEPLGFRLSKPFVVGMPTVGIKPSRAAFTGQASMAEQLAAFLTIAVPADRNLNDSISIRQRVAANAVYNGFEIPQVICVGRNRHLDIHFAWRAWLPERAAKARLGGCTRRLQLYGGLPRVRLIESLYFTTLMTSFIVINPGLVYMSVACHGGADEAHCRVGK